MTPTPTGYVSPCVRRVQGGTSMPKRKRAPGAGRKPRDPAAPSSGSFRVSVTAAELADLDRRCREAGCMTQTGKPNRAEFVRRCLWPDETELP